jgi:RNA polymerase sigma-70 factor (ECF subfamily)
MCVMGVIDDVTFEALVARHRRELHVHCYRMLGSFDEAEDLVQDVFLRAWRQRATVETVEAARAWLYRIATNACIDSLRRTARRPGDVPTPYPDDLLPGGAEPDAEIVAKETIELAFLAAIQLLPARQRAVLILRDVLGWPTADTADLLDASVASVNSALQRARATVHRHWPGGRMEWAPAADPTEKERALLQQYIDAHEKMDPAALIAVLRDDARLVITGVGTWDGKPTVAAALESGMGSLGDWRMVPTRANRQPAAAGYLRRWGDTEFRAFAIIVLRVASGALVEMTAFEDPGLFGRFGLPPVLDR